MKRLENKELEFVLAIILELIEFTFGILFSFHVLNIPIQLSCIQLFIFFIARIRIGQPKHYRIISYFDIGWRKCFIWTSSLLISLYMLSNIGIIASALFTIFSAYIISEKANIEDLKMGYKKKDEPSNYQDLIDYIEFSGINDEFFEAEEKLKKRVSPKSFAAYREIFIKKQKWKSTEEKLEISRAKLSEYIKECYNYICGRLGI